MAAGSARISADYEMDASLTTGKPRRRGGLLRPLVKAVGAAARFGWNRLAEKWTSYSFEGFIEPARHRHMIVASPKFAMLEKDAKHWSGAAGQPLGALKPARRPGAFLDVWFLLDALRGLEAATAEGEDVVRGTQCRRLAVRVDLARASAAAPNGLHPPAVDRFEDLLALPLTVWIDATHVRRVRLEEEVPTRTWQVELWDFGVSTDGLDWSRLPEWPAVQERRPAHGRIRQALHRARRRSR